MWEDKIRFQTRKSGSTIDYIVETSDIVGPASKEAARVCDEYEIPIDVTRLRVCAMMPEQYPIRGTVAPISDEPCYRERDSHGKTIWRIDDNPEGYAIFVRATHDYPVDKTVRHELAHACCWEEDGYTYESEKNHAYWCRKLDCEDTMY